MALVHFISILFAFLLLMLAFSHARNMTKEFVINKYLKLKLEQERTTIYVNNRPFRQCMYLLMNIPVNRFRDYDNIESIDQAAEVLDRSMERFPMGGRPISPEEEFRGHCSNVQAWVENDYDTRILHRNLAFPLLKRLTEVGDPLALKKFKEEIAIRYASGHPTVITFLTRGGYLKFLNPEELEGLLYDQNLPVLNDFANNLNILVETFENEDLKRRVISWVRGISNNFGMQNFPFIFSQIIKEIPQTHRQQLIKLVFSAFQYDKHFPLIQYLNNNMKYFEENEFKSIKYGNKIIAIINGTNLQLNCQNIKDPVDIKGLEDYYGELEELDLSDNQIKEMRGLEKFSNLKTLKLANNQINQIKGLNQLKELRKLSLRNNNITKITGIEKLLKLEYLDLSGNRDLTEIPETLNEIPTLKVVKLANCSIKKYSESVSRFFWMEQNYRYYSNYNPEDVRYYERTHSGKATSNNQLYKHFVKWLFKFKKLMKDHELEYEDLENFERNENKHAIWGGKLTADFKKWIFNKKQTKITSFF